MKEKRRYDVLTLFETFRNSQSRAIYSKGQKIVKLVKIMEQFFLIFESTFDSTNLLASIKYRKTAARSSDTIHDIIKFLSLARCLLKG